MRSILILATVLGYGGQDLNELGWSFTGTRRRGMSEDSAARGNYGLVEQGPSFDFNPGSAQYPPSIDRLDPILCINGTCVAPTLRYKGGDATAASWPAWTYGDTLPKVEVGANVTPNSGSPLLGADDDSAKFGSADYFQESAASLANFGTNDLVVEVVWLAQGGGGTTVFSSYAGASQKGIEAVDIGTSTRFIMGAGTAVLADVTTAAGAWYHALWFLDRSGSEAIYLNGAQANTAVISGQSASMSANKLTIGARSDATLNYGANVAYLAVWQGAGWLDTHLQAAVAAARFAQLTGVWPRIARGAAAPTAMTRASTAALRKVTAGVTSLFTVGANWPRVEKLATLNGYLSEPAVTNMLLQSEDVATSWTELKAADTQSLNAAAAVAPDGTQTADGNIADAVDTNHGFTQATGNLTAATWTASVFAKAGDKTWLYLSDNTVANATSYFNLSTCAAGTKGAGATAAFVQDYGNGWCRCGISFTGTVAAHTIAIQTADADTDKTVTGDAATVNTYFWGMQVELFGTMTSYVRTTTATVTRAVDSLTFASASNASATAGSAICSVRFPNVDTAAAAGIWSFDDATVSNRIEWQINASDQFRPFLASGGVTYADIAAAPDISDGARHVLAFGWQTNDARAYVDGAQIGSDVTVTVPVSPTTLKIGAAQGGGAMAGVIERCRVFNKVGVSK